MTAPAASLFFDLPIYPEFLQDGTAVTIKQRAPLDPARQVPAPYLDDEFRSDLAGLMQALASTPDTSVAEGAVTSNIWMRISNAYFQKGDAYLDTGERFWFIYQTSQNTNPIKSKKAIDGAVVRGASAVTLPGTLARVPFLGVESKIYRDRNGIVPEDSTSHPWATHHDQLRRYIIDMGNVLQSLNVKTGYIGGVLAINDKCRLFRFDLASSKYEPYESKGVQGYSAGARPILADPTRPLHVTRDAYLIHNFMVDMYNQVIKFPRNK